MGKRIIEELATETIQDNDFILMDNNTTPTDPDDDTAGTRKMRAKEFGAQIITVDDELSTSSENPVQNKVITGAINDLASATEITGTASGSIASFDDGSTMPLKTLQVSIEPVQSGSGDPSPINICPISGWDGANVNVSGVNLWDEEWEQGQYDASGNPYPNNECIRTKNFISVKPNTTYYQTTNVGLMQMFYYDINKEFINSAWMGSNTFTTPSNCYYVHFRLGSTYGTTYNNDISINYPSTDTSYHAYNGNTYNIAFTDGTNPLTVYGGTLDVTSGLLTVDYIKELYDGSDDEIWNAYTNSNGFIISKSEMKSGNAQSGLANWLKTITNNSEFGIRFGGNNTLIYCNHITDNISGISDVTSWRTYLSNHELEIMYPLATPQTYSLTPTAVTTLLGNNNIFADCGDVDVEYVKDTDIVIKKLLYKDLTATLSANATSLTITDSAITTDATYDIFTDTYGVSPTAVSVSNGSMTLTFTARGSATKVKVRVML